MARRSDSVAEMAADLLDDPAAGERMEKLVGERRLVEQLTFQRLKLGKSQTEVARRMGCNPSKVSRMEAGFDRDLKLGDILDYLSALDMGLFLTLINPASPIADRIKQAVFQIDALLQDLRDLAAPYDDKEINQGIDRFYHEVLFNFIKRFKSTYDSFCERSQIVFSQEGEPIESKRGLSGCLSKKEVSRVK
jgi:transcriptional regulator with XRE-family HTH domain